MARPKKPAAQARRHVVKFLLTDAEMLQLRRQADALGVEPNECARVKATDGAAPAWPEQRTAAHPLFPFELRQDLRRVGVNINQIARVLNTTGEHHPDELREASADLGRIFRLMLADAAQTRH